MSLDKYLLEKNCIISEGYIFQEKEQVKNIINIINNVYLTKKDELKIMEIGFNAGHSSSLFLYFFKNSKIVSFDLGVHDYIKYGKEFIDLNYPKRHLLLIGDSTKSVPTYIEEHLNKKFDIIFIDGGHDYEVALSDMENCYKLAHKDTIVILDDVTFKDENIAHWTIGPTRVWNEFLNNNKLIELGRIEYEFGRGMVWGKYKI